MVSFKLSQPGDNAVRKANFDRNPSWGQLAAKVESLFKLPSNEVGLSYVDTDGDAVTISTDEELADFYASGASKAPKFAVIRLAPRAPSVAQVPDGFYRSESPEPVIVEERDWGRQRMGSMPFSTLPPNVLNSMNFGFMPGEVDGRAGTPAYSEARIEEIPSSEASRSQSVNEDYSRGSKNNSNNNRSKEGKFNPMERSQRPAKGRQITDLSAVDSTDEPERAPPRPRDSIDSDMGSDIEDLDRPRVRRGASASVQVNGAPSIYDDIAGVISALNQILIRSANGTYLQPQLENATSAANRAAIEDSARRVTESLEGVLRTLGTHSSNPRGAGFGIGTASSGVNTPAEERANLRAPLSSNGRPRPSSMMNGQAIGGTSPNQPSFNSSPRNEPAPQGAPDGRIPPFVPPSFPQKFNPQQRGPTFAGGPANQQPRGFFGEGPPTQAPRPMGQERQFSGNRFQPAAGPQSQRTPRQDSYQPEVSPETLSAFGTDEQSTQQDEREKERERLEAARQLYKQEKANFRAQREAERQERAERRARREKGYAYGIANKR
ncbi:hypothetical protein FRB95_000887 [Tulasnella sp. JGI-2019a]|nr:hypothetical protein FRB95_000887 [Tulasnella sp. JGI-2019a]